MAILTGPEIARLVKRTKEAREDGLTPPMPIIDITPFDEANCGPNSYDVRLSDKLLIYRAGGSHWQVSGHPSGYGCEVKLNVHSQQFVLDSREPNPTKEVTISDGGIVLIPGVLYLGSTVEFTETHGLVPVIETRSSLARLGVSAHLSAGFGDDGWGGCWTLELTVVHPVKLWAGDRICQVAFHTINGERDPYRGKYSNDTTAVASRMHEDTH